MTLRSWYSVTDRLGYFIEDGNDFLKSRDAEVGDYFMVYRDSIESPPKCVLLDGKSCNVKHPVEGPDAEIYFSDLPLLLLPPGENGDIKSSTDSVCAIKKLHKGCLAGLKRKDFGELDISDDLSDQRNKVARPDDPLVSLLHLLE